MLISSCFFFNKDAVYKCLMNLKKNLCIFVGLRGSVNERVLYVDGAISASATEN